MLQTLSPELKKARDLAGTAHVLAIMALAGLTVIIVVNGGLPIGAILLDTELPWPTRVHDSSLVLIAMLPAFLFLAAVDRLHKALNLYSKGEFFTDAASYLVAQSGDHAVQAMVTMILVVPNLTLWIRDGGGGFDIHVEAETVGMLAFALFVAAVGRILAAATQLKAENDGFV